MRTGWPPPPCCAIPASSSTIRATIATRNTSSPARKSTAIPPCSAPSSPPSPATSARAAPSPATAPCATFPPTNTRTSTAPWCCCGWPWRSTRIAPATCLRVAARVYPKRIYLEIKPGRTGRGTGALVAAQGSRLLPRSLWPGTLCHAAVNRPGHARIDDPLQLRRMPIQINARNRRPCACADWRRHCPSPAAP